MTTGGSSRGFRIIRSYNLTQFNQIKLNPTELLQVTPHHFVLLVERTVAGCKYKSFLFSSCSCSCSCSYSCSCSSSPTPHDTAASFPSLLGHAVRQALNNPLYRSGNSISQLYHILLSLLHPTSFSSGSFTSFTSCYFRSTSSFSPPAHPLSCAMCSS